MAELEKRRCEAITKKGQCKNGAYFVMNGHHVCGLHQFPKKPLTFIS